MQCPGRRPVECMDIDNTSPKTREERRGVEWREEVKHEDRRGGEGREGM